MGDETTEDLEWEEWLSRSDEQNDAIVKREMEEHGRWYDALPLKRKHAYLRSANLGNCLTARRLRAMPGVPAIIAENAMQSLKGAQMRLLKIRVWRATGTYPGEA